MRFKPYCGKRDDFYENGMTVLANEMRFMKSNTHMCNAYHLSLTIGTVLGAKARGKHVSRFIV